MNVVAKMKDRVEKLIGKSRKEDVKLVGHFKVEHFDKHGVLLGARHVNNTIVNAGLAVVSGLVLSDIGGTAFDYIAIGTGTTGAAATDTALETEITTNGGERTAGTGTQVTTSVTNDTAQLVATFTFTGAFAVTESGVFNAASAGTMLCRQTFSAVNVASGDSLQITWKVQFS